VSGKPNVPFAGRLSFYTDAQLLHPRTISHTSTFADVQLIQWAFDGVAAIYGDVGVYFGGFQGVIAQQSLYVPYIGASFQ
jgi:hypothetical protein